MKVLVKSTLFPSLLSFVVLLSIMNVYEGVNVFSAAGVFVANSLLFAAYEKLRLLNKNWVSTLCVITLFTFAIFVAVQLVGAAGRENARHLIDWFFKGGDEDLHFPIFTAALLTFFTPFMASTVFYFTNVRYNPFYLMLTCMTTFAIYAKTLTDVPFIFPALIIAVFLFIAVERRWYRGKSEAALGYRRFVLTGLCFVAGSAYIAGLFPPAETTPYRSAFDEFLAQGRFAEPLGFANIIDANMSGGASSRANLEQVLFVVQADDLEYGYLRRQVFDTFDIAGHWNRSSDGRDFTLIYEELPNTMQMQNFGGRQDFNTAVITVVTSSHINYIPTIPNTFAVGQGGGVRTPIGATVRNEFFFDDDPASRQGAIYVVFYSDTPDSVDFRWISDAQYAAYVRSALDLPEYRGWERVRDLALELTAPYDNDFDRAVAIQRHFYNGEFTYDLSFTPARKCVYTFLFESQRGTCSDFATAMTILVREAGIPARYVEGYVMDERDEDNGRFIVRIEHGHAWPEVYIDGVGWVVFEPTIPGGNSGRIGYQDILAILGCIGAAAALTLLFMLFVLPLIRENRFRNRARAATPDVRVRLIYERIYSSFMKSQGLQTRTLSSRDVDSYAAEEFGVQLFGLTESYDRIVYGGGAVADGDYFGTYLAFCEGVRRVRRENRRAKGKNLDSPQHTPNNPQSCP